MSEPRIVAYPAELDSDRLFPADPRTREIARALHTLVEGLPIISPHGHVSAELLSRNERFPNPATLLVTPDHYVTRLLHASGVSLDQLGLGADPAEPITVWRHFISRLHLFAGTASGYWLDGEFANVFGVNGEQLARASSSFEQADALFHQLDAQLSQPEFRPAALFDLFDIDVLATTDDPLDPLEHHQKLAAMTAAGEGLAGRVLPTFRPDAYLNPAHPNFHTNIERLVATTGDDATFAGYLAALRSRRNHFIAAGAVSADHGVATPLTLKLDAAESERLFQGALAGSLSMSEQTRFEAGMLYQMAKMSVDDGLVMTLHPGSFRNHHTATFEQFGADTGHDIPLPVSYTEGLRAVLQDFGTARDFHFVLFTLDETTFSRELAPIAGFYPSVYLGAPWWFLDAPDAMLRFRAAVTETTGFSRSSGFIDDTRAFCSIPARHDASRRIEAAFLARLVAEARLTHRDAERIIVDLVDAAPRRVFKL